MNAWVEVVAHRGVHDERPLAWVTEPCHQSLHRPAAPAAPGSGEGAPNLQIM